MKLFFLSLVLTSQISLANSTCDVSKFLGNFTGDAIATVKLKNGAKQKINCKLNIQIASTAADTFSIPSCDCDTGTGPVSGWGCTVGEVKIDGNDLWIMNYDYYKTEKIGQCNEKSLFIYFGRKNQFANVYKDTQLYMESIALEMLPNGNTEFRSAYILNYGTQIKSSLIR